MKLDSDPFPINMVELESKKMLIQSDQAESARERNVIDDSAPPRMIKPINPEIGVWKVNGGRRQAPRPKPTVSMLLENIPHARPTMCLIGSEVISVQDLLLDLAVMSKASQCI